MDWKWPRVALHRVHRTSEQVSYVSRPAPESGSGASGTGTSPHPGGERGRQASQRASASLAAAETRYNLELFLYRELPALYIDKIRA
jgi:hypothetical protein